MSRDLLEEILKKKHIATPTGKIDLVPCEITTYSTENAISRIHDLHLRAAGLEPLLEVEKQPTRSEAQALYKVAISSSMIKVLTLPEEHRRTHAATVASVVAAFGDYSGLDPLLLSLLISLPKCEERDRIRRLIMDLPPPALAGGGFQKSFVFEPSKLQTQQYSLSALLSIASEINDSAMVVDRLLAKHTTQLGMSFDVCKSQYAVATSIVLGTVGAVTGAFGGFAAGGPLGAIGGSGVAGIAGATYGLELGKELGGINCRPDREASDSDKKPASDDGEPGNPDEPEEIDKSEKEGCVAPYWNDLNFVDPYRSASIFTARSYVLDGPGLESIIVREQGNVRLKEIPRSSLVDGRLQFVNDELLSKVRNRIIVERVNSVAKIITSTPDHIRGGVVSLTEAPIQGQPITTTVTLDDGQTGTVTVGYRYDLGVPGLQFSSGEPLSSETLRQLNKTIQVINFGQPRE